MAVKIFFCYARKDQSFLKKLTDHLMPFQRQGFISMWADINIDAGTEWEQEIKKHLQTAGIILLLISPAFIASEYCYSKEMQLAMERHERGEVCVIPIILRPCYWQIAGLDKLQVLPTDAIPVVSSKWHTQDEAFLNIAEGIEKKIVELRNRLQTVKNSDAENGKRTPQKQNIQPISPLQIDREVETTVTRGEVESSLIMENDNITQVYYSESENKQETNEATNDIKADISLRDITETTSLVGKQIADSISRVHNSLLKKSPISVLTVLFLLLLAVNIVYLPLQSLSFLSTIVSFIDAILTVSIIFVFSFNRDYIFNNFREEIPNTLRKIMNYFKSD